MSSGAKLVEQFLLQNKSTVISGNSNAHIVSFLHSRNRNSLA